jgi:putative SOS response-associated peptidase YedK
MCGRFTLTFSSQEVAEILNIVEEIDSKPRYNIAPMQEVPVVINEGRSHLRLFQWGLVPFWAKDQTIGNKLINARAETIDIKPSFRHCFERQRCLIPADGYYEWKKEGNRKIPYRIALTDRPLFCFAGIWDTWKNPEGKIKQSCTIITTEANPLMAALHHRMPVILPQNREGAWLDPTISDYAYLKSLLTPYPDTSMNAYEVSPYVNSAKNDSVECIRPVAAQQALFD